MENNSQQQTIANSPLVDMTCVNAVESLFRGKLRDPWAKRRASLFTDFYVFSKKPRFIVPVIDSKLDDRIAIPSMVTKLKQKDSSVLKEIRCDVSYEQRHLDPKLLEEYFLSFSNWIRQHVSSFKQWISVHHEKWIFREQWKHNLEEGFLYNVENLQNIVPADLRTLALECGIDVFDIYYAFDIVLRYSLYGEQVGNNEHYLSHPIRTLQSFKHLKLIDATGPIVPLGVGDFLTKHIESLSLDNYVEILHDTRNLLRAHDVVDEETGHVNKGSLSDFVDRLKVSAKLKKADLKLGSLGSLIALFGAFPPINLPLIVSGAGMLCTSLIWKGKVPAKVGELKWLHWALEHHIEIKKKNLK